MHKRYQQTGFTIVELLIVIVVIGILAAITIVAYQGVQNRAHNTAVNSDLANSGKKLEQYKVLNDSYPKNRDEFRAAQTAFSLGSHRYSVYCQKGSGADEMVAIVSRSVGGDDRAYVSGQGVVNYSGSWPDAPVVCANAGISSPDASTWLRGNGPWGSWVVY